MNTSESSQLPTSAKGMEFIFVYGSLRMGGIETLIVRMANFFVSHSIPVSIYCSEGGVLLSLLDNRVNFIKNSDTNALIKAASAYAANMSVMTNILMISFDPISAARALMIEAKLSDRKSLVHISGVYHPRAYFMAEERSYRVFLNFMVASAIGADRIFFMNEECRAAHATRWKIDLSKSPIFALPINQVEPRWKSSGQNIVRVVSVGRLVPFKAYNVGAAKVVRACLDRGIAVMWDIYGDGPLQASIQAEIETHQVSAHVRLMGTLDYCDYSEKVAGYDVFIGMGTSALEAAMLGVPTICATVDEATKCYGYLQDLPLGNVGELQSSPPSVQLSDLICRYSEANNSLRNNLSRRSRQTAEMYGMPKFSEEITSMLSIEAPTPSRTIKRMVAGLYYFATEGFLVRGIRYCAPFLRRS